METYKVTEMYRLFDLDKINDIATKVKHCLDLFLIISSCNSGASRSLSSTTDGAVRNKISPKAIFVKT
jgi:hypothetical protein